MKNFSIYFPNSLIYTLQSNYNSKQAFAPYSSLNTLNASSIANRQKSVSLPFKLIFCNFICNETKDTKTASQYADKANKVNYNTNKVNNNAIIANKANKANEGDTFK
jgi:hypothetical protein